MSIQHLHQKEGISRHTVAGTATVLCFDDTTELFYSHSSAAHLHQRSHYGTHHIAQEAVGSDGETPLVLSHPVPTGLCNGAVVGLGVCIDLGKGREVLVLHQHTGRAVHKFKVGIAVHLPTV